MAMTEVRLHGELAAEFGRIWHFDIATPLEAVRAIEANSKGFIRKIRELTKRGMCFRVRTKSHDYDSDDVGTTLGNSQRLDIIPIILGASAGVRFVVGAVLVALSFTPYAAAAGPYMFNAGVALMLGSVVEWLTAIPKRKDEPGGANSWTIDGPMNNVDQGLPVPIIFGEVLTGSYAISGGISVSELTPDGTLNAFVALGGEFEVSVRFPSGTSSTSTAEFRISAGPLNMAEPLTYDWTVTGFTGATNVTLVDDGTATLRVIVEYPTATATLTGDIFCAMTGLVPSTNGAQTPTPVTATSATMPLTLHIEIAESGGD